MEALRARLGAATLPRPALVHCQWANHEVGTVQPVDEVVELCRQHGVTVHAPAGMPTGLCYAMFTWNSIGIIDHQSMLNMTYEAWVRVPVTVIKNLDG